MMVYNIEFVPTYLKYVYIYFCSFRFQVGSGSGFFFQLSRICGENVGSSSLIFSIVTSLWKDQFQAQKTILCHVRVFGLDIRWFIPTCRPSLVITVPGLEPASVLGARYNVCHAFNVKFIVNQKDVKGNGRQKRLANKKVFFPRIFFPQLHSVPLIRMKGENHFILWFEKYCLNVGCAKMSHCNLGILEANPQTTIILRRRIQWRGVMFFL